MNYTQPVAKKRFRNKIKYILETYLRSVIDASNDQFDLPNHFQIKYPNTITVGQPAIPANTDIFPSISIVETNSIIPRDNFQNIQTDIVTLSVVSIDYCDEADVGFAGERNSELLESALYTLEKYLPNVDDPLPFRVDINSSVNQGTQRLDNDNWLVSAEGQVTCYLRYEMPWTPTLYSGSLPPVQKPYNVSRFEPDNLIFSVVSGSTVTDIATDLSFNNINSVSVSSGTISSSDYVGLNLSGSNWLTGSDTFTVINQTQKTIPTITTGSNVISIPAASISDGDQIVFTFVNSALSNRMVSYGIDITLS